METIIITLVSFCLGIFVGMLYEREKHKPWQINIDKSVKKIDESIKKIDIYTFEHFWSEFFRINPGRKLDKQHCKNLWDSCKFNDRKKKAIQDISLLKSKRLEQFKSPLEYLKIKLLKP